MILDKIKIKNYRQYRDIEIEFSKNPSKNFTIIKGNNGTGKTTLLNALTWCLYGEEIHQYDNQVSGMPICNNKTTNLADEGEFMEVFVQIDFLDEGEILRIKRSLDFVKKDSEAKPSALGSKFEIFRQEGNDFVMEDDPYIIDRNIPKKIEEYFFFDGARLGEYFQVNSNQSIKDSFFDLSQLNLVESVDKNIDKVVTSYISKQKKTSPNIAGINDEIFKVTNNIDNLEEKIKTVKSTVKTAKEQYEEINNELIFKNGEKIKKDVEREKRLNDSIKRIDLKLHGRNNDGGLYAEQRNLILKTYPLMLSYPSFKELLSQGKSSREKGYIPPKFRKSFLKDLLDDKKCICGADLSEGKHKEAIEKLLESTKPITDKSEEVTSVLTHVSEVIINTKLRDFKKGIAKIDGEIRSLEKERGELLEELNKINENLKNNPLKEINHLTNIRNDLREVIDKGYKDIGTFTNQIQVYETRLKNLNNKLEKEKELKNKYDLIDKKITFVKEVKRASKIISDDLTENMRLSIEKLTKDKFTKIQWKDEEFVDIKVTDNYDVYIVNRSGNEERPGDLSDGEKLCLGLCFTSALHNVSGFDLPIVMDTPLGNLDVDMRRNIAKFLPEFVGEKQIVLLVTGTEYTDDFRDILLDSIGKEYTIEWENSDDGKESKVIYNGE